VSWRAKTAAYQGLVIANDECVSGCCQVLGAVILFAGLSSSRILVANSDSRPRSDASGPN